MERIWAPWRMQYIESGPPGQGCIFCVGDDTSRDEEKYVLHRAASVFTMLNAFPYNSGHLMIAPYRHVADPTLMREEELSEMMSESVFMMKVLRGALQPDGFNLGMNVGRQAGAGVVDHTHLHIVPRWGGDTNFMPILGDTRIIPQALADTYKKLRRAIEEM
jgi:ATP adenylyltransferase